jgi:hypothetical protein
VIAAHHAVVSDDDDDAPLPAAFFRRRTETLDQGPPALHVLFCFDGNEKGSPNSCETRWMIKKGVAADDWVRRWPDRDDDDAL